MRARDLARACGIIRVAIGAGWLVAPRPTAAVWLGRAAVPPSGVPLARALGVRELVLGVMVLRALDRPEVVGRWLTALAACDAVDVAATVAARRSLPTPGMLLVGALASAGAVGQLWAARELASSPEQVAPGR